jgi:hypothetical protein
VPRPGRDGVSSGASQRCGERRARPQPRPLGAGASSCEARPPVPSRSRRTREESRPCTSSGIATARCHPDPPCRTPHLGSTQVVPPAAGELEQHHTSSGCSRFASRRWARARERQRQRRGAGVAAGAHVPDADAAERRAGAAAGRPLEGRRVRRRLVARSGAGAGCGSTGGAAWRPHLYGRYRLRTILSIPSHRGLCWRPSPTRFPTQPRDLPALPAAGAGVGTSREASSPGVAGAAPLADGAR